MKIRISLLCVNKFILKDLIPSLFKVYMAEDFVTNLITAFSFGNRVLK